MAGVTLYGFEGRTLDDVYEGFKEKVRAQLGSGVTFAEQSPEAALARILAEELGAGWAMGEAVYLAFSRETAQGAALDNIGALTGTERLQAAPSTLMLTVTGDAGTVLPLGAGASVQATGVRVATTEAVTFMAAPAWAQATVYAVGARVTTSNPGARVYRCKVAGASAGSGTGPTGTAASVVDGTVTWAYVGDGAAFADVDAQVTVTGPVPVAAGGITQKDTPLSGWLGVTNVLDAVLGRNVETDAAYRVRQVRELRGLGKGSASAIRALLSDTDLVPGATAVTVFENDTGVVNADGMPGHSLELLIEGGDDQRIREVLWDSKPVGIYTHGTVVGTVTDAGGVHTVRHTRPTVLTLYVQATALKLTPDAPVDDDEAEAQLAAAVVAYGDALVAGRDVVTTKVAGALAAIPWVHDTGSVLIGLTALGVSTANIPVTTRQRADFDSSRCVLTFTRLTEGQL